MSVFRRLNIPLKRAMSREFCLWLVCTRAGSVRKMRFSLFQFSAVASFAGLFLALLIFVAGDYSRVQFLRVKHLFSYKQVRTELDQLTERRVELQREIASLEASRSKAINYSDRVAERVGELRAIIDTARTMGLSTPEYLAPSESQVGVGGEDIGGHEYDCDEACLKELKTEQISKKKAERELLEEMESLLFFITQLPIGSPVEGHLSSSFGFRRSPFTRKIKMHGGLDFSVPTGSAVKVTADGVIGKVRRSSAYGLMIDVRHENGVVTRYAHLSRALVKSGDRVCRGEEIALAGSTGRSTGPHLHYEVRINDKPINPIFFVGLPDHLHAALS